MISHCMKVGVLKQREQKGKGSTRAKGVLGQQERWDHGSATAACELGLWER